MDSSDVKQYFGKFCKCYCKYDGRNCPKECPAESFVEYLVKESD